MSHPFLPSGRGSIYIIRFRFAGSPWHDSIPPVPAWVPPPPGQKYFPVGPVLIVLAAVLEITDEYCIDR